MAIPSERLRHTIIDLIGVAAPRAVHVDELYRAVEAYVTLDDEDRARSARGRSRDEPAWKKRVRATLGEMKRAGSLVNDRYHTWRFPSPDP
ncbi:MAG TPA: hypothetical protein VFJ82_20725 [Longimicrobium sp.]|nr:hypothetical protein [Longimicrobium sp.]